MDVAPPLQVDSLRVGVRPHALVRRLSRGTFALVMVALLVSMVVSAIYPGRSMTPPWFSVALGLTFLTAMATTTAALAAQIACWIAPAGRGLVTVDATGVRVEGRRERYVPRADIEAAWTLRDGDASWVEFQLRNGDVLSAGTRSAEESAAVLDAAGVDPARRALRMPLGGAAVSLGLGAAAAVPASCVASMIAVGAERLLPLPSTATGFLIFALFGAFVAAAVRVLSPPVVSVGRDGLSVQGALGAWFVPFEAIGGLHRTNSEIALRLRDGSTRRISTLGTSEPRREALYASIAAGVGEASAPAELSARLASLDRNGRTAAEWREALRLLTREQDGYRRAGLTRDEVAAALEDPHTPAERRVAAAFALALMDPARAGTRVRVVAETVAHEPIRVALERAAGGDLDDETLEATDEAHGRARSR